MVWKLNSVTVHCLLLAASMPRPDELHSTFLCSALLCSSVLLSTLLGSRSALLCSTPLRSAPIHSALIRSNPIHSARLDSTEEFQRYVIRESERPGLALRALPKAMLCCVSCLWVWSLYMAACLSYVLEDSHPGRLNECIPDVPGTHVRLGM